MKTSLKVARGLQLLGAVFLILAIVSCSDGGLTRGGEVGWKIILGLLLIIGPKTYEWLTRE